jgi:hypothetical protein
VASESGFYNSVVGGNVDLTVSVGEADGHTVGNPTEKQTGVSLVEIC